MGMPRGTNSAPLGSRRDPKDSARLDFLDFRRRLWLTTWAITRNRYLSVRSDAGTRKTGQRRLNPMGVAGP